MTLRSDETEITIDYVLVNNKYRNSVKDVIVIPGEEIRSQHLLLMDMVFKKRVGGKVKFREKFKLWRWREPKVKEKFTEGVNNKCDYNEDWCVLKRLVCFYTEGKPRHFDTWWWNQDKDVAVCRKRELYRIWKQSRNEEDGRNIVRQKKMLRE